MYNDDLHIKGNEWNFAGRITFKFFFFFNTDIYMLNFNTLKITMHSQLQRWKLCEHFTAFGQVLAFNL